MGIEKEPLELSADFTHALDLIEKQDEHLFITGRAGTGKSTLLQLFRKTTRKKTVVLAPTGVAALNVGGQTIHSFFGFPPRLLDKKDIKKRRNRKLYQNIEVLIIDEISMVRADLLDNIDYFLRLNRDDPYPFGGVQVVFFGDLFQLPPVIASDTEARLFQLYYDSPYFFSAKVFEQGFEMGMLELRKVYRQENRHFLRLLDAVRLNQTDYDDLEDLNERYIPSFQPEEFYITLSARNATVNAINTKKLNEIPFPEKVFHAAIKGEFNPKLYPAEAGLKLKLGAQVMFVKNDPKKRFVNGTIGRVESMENDSISIKVEDDKGNLSTIELERMEWEIIRYKQGLEDPNKIETENGRHLQPVSFETRLGHHYP